MFFTISSLLALDGIFLGTGPEFNMNSHENFAGGLGLYSGFDLSQHFVLGLKTNYSYNFKNMSMLEVAALLRFYPFNQRFFLQTESGISILFENTENSIKFLGGINTGWTFLMGKKLFIEPTLRIGYPYLFGVGVNFGLYFTPKKNQIVRNNSLVLLDQEILNKQLLENTKNEKRINVAMEKISREIINNTLEYNTIALINICSDNEFLPNYIIDKLEYQLIYSGKFIIINRRMMDIIRHEQNIQISNDVSDSSAALIGYNPGANIVITGSYAKTETSQIISINVLDVLTAKLLLKVKVELS